MFQSFEDIGGSAHCAERLARMRAALGALGLDGFLVPRADEHQNEYVPAHAERLLWLTGFSGSWGMAVVLRGQAALFVDGRYILQARAQTDTSLFEIVKTPDTNPTEWIGRALKAGDKLGFDPRLHTIKQVRELRKAVERAKAQLVAVDKNPIDELWTDRPPAPRGPLTLHPLQYAGQTTADKLATIRKTLVEAGEDAVVLSSPESIAWLFNIRGCDVVHTPIVLAYAVVPVEGPPELFIDPAKIGPVERAALESFAVLRTPEALPPRLKAAANRYATVRLDPASASQWLADILGGAGVKVSEAQDPCLLPKAIKNATEIAGARAAHVRDGIAVSRFLAWVDAHAISGEIDEITATRRLEEFRAETGELREISFDTISGAGPNGAIVHYRVTASTNRKLEPGTLYLVDSGGQYFDGTTDITRTIAIGEPSDEMRRHFTLVLKGHIAIATARFPKGTRGIDLDGFARRALWAAGLDYDHGTGHGVGSYLSVHEGPQSISKRGVAVLEPGMIVSNEPGYYREGAYGIRIENLLLVEPLSPVPGGEREMMSFETLTLAPIDRKLVDPRFLQRDELNWLNAYHARVRHVIAPRLCGPERAWLEAATEPISIEGKVTPG